MRRPSGRSESTVEERAKATPAEEILATVLFRRSIEVYGPLKHGEIRQHREEDYAPSKSVNPKECDKTGYDDYDDSFRPLR
jgi:predicted Zn-ribbon and HTH transcriptional regulator